MVCVWGEWEEFGEWKRSKECFEVGARRREIGLAVRVRVVSLLSTVDLSKVSKRTCQNE